MSNLNIRQLRLRDYRCFESLDIEFHHQLTVLVASNGAGKTSILDAIAVAFGPYVGAFDESTGHHFVASDIRLTRVRATATHEMEYAPRGVRLEATGYIPGSVSADITDSDETWKRVLVGPTKAKTTIKDAKELIAYGKRLQVSVRTPNTHTILPLVAYYGTGRLWQMMKLMEGRLPRTSRTIGYTDCLNPGSSYKSFVAWFRYWVTNSFKNQMDAKKAGRVLEATEFDHFVESVSTAINICLAPAGWGSIDYSFAREELVAHHVQHGELPVALLSDGIRNMIGMIADIAFRATKLNPQLGAQAAKETPGVILIDEVDMHLHPEWQQVVLQNLLIAFPKLQFIVTTHSPQVLSTVHRDNIRVIGTDANGQAIAAPPLFMPYGEPSGHVMHSVMGVDPQPPVPEKVDLQQLTEWVDQGNYQNQEAKDMMRTLTDLLGEQHPQLQKLQRSIHRQENLIK